ncbi:MAG: PASTA domain-containing protein [Actinobacteria bacterium]|nr:PASTA domain-containing protein [Actinomycetota bacterium]
MSKFCPNCGNESAPDQKFCVSCGKPLAGEPTEPTSTGATQVTPPPVPPALATPSAGGGGPKKKNTALWISIGAGALALIAIILTVVLVFAVGGSKDKTEKKKTTTVSVPEVVGLDEKEAREKVEDADLEFEPIYKTDNNVEKGRVTDQRPDEGKKVKKGSMVTVVIAVRGQVDVPNFVGQTQDQALVMLTKTLLNFKLTQQPTGDQNQHGKIISQTPGAGTKVDAGSEVAIVVGIYQGQAPQPTSNKGHWATRQVQCPVCGGEGVIRSAEETVNCEVCGGAGGVYVPDYDEEGNYTGDVWVTCDECGGLGYVVIPAEESTCSNCGGSGWVSERYWVAE